MLFMSRLNGILDSWKVYFGLEELNYGYVLSYSCICVKCLLPNSTGYSNIKSHSPKITFYLNKNVLYCVSSWYGTSPFSLWDWRVLQLDSMERLMTWVETKRRVGGNRCEVLKVKKNWNSSKFCGLWPRDGPGPCSGFPLSDDSWGRFHLSHKNRTKCVVTLCILASK